MSLDISRKSFNAIKDYSGVLMQQGRVQLDSDWNELMDILDRRHRAGTLDIIGRATVPKETPDGFKIALTGGTITIGAGRMYVDGMLAENHGDEPYSFERVLAELGSDEAIRYDEQPYFPNAEDVSPVPEDGGPHLIYLDVWEREITHLKEDDLIEKAVGVDTTGRSQTAWQVKVLPEVGGEVTCQSDDEQIDGWEDITKPSAGRLTTGVVATTEDGPCVIPPNGNYRGLDNRLYRVEIHEGGPQGSAAFKWSRDNASVATNVVAIADLDKLTVTSVGRDDYLRFSAGDWVEISDDWREFAGEAGFMRKVKSVDDATRTITLEDALPAGIFPTDAQGRTNPDRHTRLIRWDQRGEVRDETGALIVDLDSASSDGLIPVPPAGTSVVLENGIAISFELEPSSGSFKALDYWVFAARTADASVEALEQAPPDGIHHHYARLALVTFPSTVTDCRVLWPPDFGGGGCDCDVCVTPESHASGAATIQWAVDQVKGRGGTVCLRPGVYSLGDNPVIVDGAVSLRLHGGGWTTILTYNGEGPAFIVQNSLGVTIEDLAFVISGDAQQPGPDLLLRNSAGTTVQGCAFLQLRGGGSAALGLSGLLLITRIRENIFFSAAGISNSGAKGMDAIGGAMLHGLKDAMPLLTVELNLEDNTLLCRQAGISLNGYVLHAGETRLAHNTVVGGDLGGLLLTGAVFPGSGVDVAANEVWTTGVGIAVGVDGARVINNDITSTEDARTNHGIMVLPGLDRKGVDFCQILGNRIARVGGAGIMLTGMVKSAMIKQNVIEDAEGGGILMSAESAAESISVENNQLLNIARTANEKDASVVGIRLLAAERAEIASNSITGLGLSAVQSTMRIGIQVAGKSLRVAGNEVSDIGPEEFIGRSAGIEAVLPFDRADIIDNVVRRSSAGIGEGEASRWYALRITGASLGLAEAGFDLKTGMKMKMDANLGAEADNPEMIAEDAELHFNFENKPSYHKISEDAAYVLLKEGVLGMFAGRLKVMPRGKEIVGVRGNLFEAYGSVPVVLILGAGAFGFSDNRCLQGTGTAMPGGRPVVRISAGAVIANSCYIQGPGRRLGFQIMTPDNAPYTVLGNIASGGIQVNGAALGDPWKDMNVLTA